MDPMPLSPMVSPFLLLEAGLLALVGSGEEIERAMLMGMKVKMLLSTGKRSFCPAGCQFDRHFESGLMVGRS